ncbi:MAG: glycerophosphodiester phosphodiesterase [Anaerolineae bacterium]
MSTLHPLQIVHHKAALDDSLNPPNSLAAIRECLEAGASWIEVDVTALAEDDYLLVHDSNLEAETNGIGAVGMCNVQAARNLRLLHRDLVTEHPAALLSEVVALLTSIPGNTRLQLDFKNHAPFSSAEPLQRLVEIIRPLGTRALVSSMADWQLRQLAQLAPWLELGFDIHLHIDCGPPRTTPEPDALPRHKGAYGYRDDHPLASRCWGSPAAYLAERCDEMLNLVPSASTFYCRHSFLVRGLQQGFSWAQALHQAGKRLDAWTLDADHEQSVVNARILADAGCDQFTSNTPLALAALLNSTEEQI